MDYQGDYAQFIKIIGDVMTDGIDKSSVVSAKDKWLNLPANINKLPALKGKSIDAILALGLPPQAATNVSKKWERIKSMFVWARANGYIAENFAAGIGIKSKATVREKFSDGDLKLLFESEEYKTHAFEEAFQFWVPLIALFSGARLEEICQLHLADVKAHEQGHFFHFTTAVDSEAGDIGHTKNLKNDSSDRLCPVHQKLIDLGLLIYIESQRDQGYKRLFTELKPDGQGKVSPRVSEWFTEYRKRKGVGAKSDRSTKVFHSFRHTMIAQLEQKGVPQDVREKLSGHKSKSITVSVYGSTGLDQRLVSNLAKLQFEIEFTPFKMGAIR